MAQRTPDSSDHKLESILGVADFGSSKIATRVRPLPPVLLLRRARPRGGWLAVGIVFYTLLFALPGAAVLTRAEEHAQEEHRADEGELIEHFIESGSLIPLLEHVPPSYKLASWQTDHHETLLLADALLYRFVDGEPERRERVQLHGTDPVAALLVAHPDEIPSLAQQLPTLVGAVSPEVLIARVLAGDLMGRQQDVVEACAMLERTAPTHRAYLFRCAAFFQRKGMQKKAAKFATIFESDPMKTWGPLFAARASLLSGQQASLEGAVGTLEQSPLPAVPAQELALVRLWAGRESVPGTQLGDTHPVSLDFQRRAQEIHALQQAGAAQDGVKQKRNRKRRKRHGRNPTKLGPNRAVDGKRA